MTPSRTSLGSWLALATGLVAGASLVWFVGPVLALRGWHPLETVAARGLVIAALLQWPLLAWLWRRSRAQRLAQRAAQQPDALDTVVDQRFHQDIRAGHDLSRNALFSNRH